MKLCRGEAMLISVLVLTAIMLGFVVVGIKSDVQHFQAGTALENKKVAAGAATACMELAINRLGRNAGYAGNETVTVVGQITCLIRPVLLGAETWTLETQAQVAEQYARQRVVITSRVPVTIGSWTEVSTF